MAASLVVAVAVSFVVILISVHAFQLLSNARRRLPPGPLPLPLVGNLLHIGRGCPHRTLARLAERYGSLMSVRLGVVQAVVVSSADVASEILHKHNAQVADRPPWSTRGIANGHQRQLHHRVSKPHARWRALRRLCATELFAPSRLNALQPLRQEKVRELVRHVSEKAALGEPVTVRDPAFTASMNMLSRTVFSKDLDSGPSVRGLKDLVKEGTVLVMTPNVSDFYPVVAAADLQGLRRKLTPIVAHAYEMIDKQIEQRLRDRQAGEPRKDDMLDVVLDEWKKEGSLIDHNAMRGLFTDLFVAGADTSSTTVEWAMAELLQNPQVMNKVKRELREVLGTKTEVEESDISQLPYLQAMVKEVLRLHPPVAMTYYRAEATVEVQGYQIPQGTIIILNISAVHRNENTWDNPDKFEPERFMNKEREFSGKDCRLIPFGGGRRICLGLPLANRTVHTILASLLHQFEWNLPEEGRSNGVDMAEKYGVVVSLATPLKVIPQKCAS
ncbi:hypothetical protein QOZ80_2BG0186940 [Eleusine coracana subsp. coracana]|nr:hypothetical protein QOZ80_2BG0186940 [Eleusine coracana subsp. coracana]